MGQCGSKVGPRDKQMSGDSQANLSGSDTADRQARKEQSMAKDNSAKNPNAHNRLKNPQWSKGSPRSRNHNTTGQATQRSTKSTKTLRSSRSSQRRDTDMGSEKSKASMSNVDVLLHKPMCPNQPDLLARIYHSDPASYPPIVHHPAAIFGREKSYLNQTPRRDLDTLSQDSYDWEVSQRKQKRQRKALKNARFERMKTVYLNRPATGNHNGSENRITKDDRHSLQRSSSQRSHKTMEEKSLDIHGSNGSSSDENIAVETTEITPAK